jgi:hypothetical protein
MTSKTSTKIVRFDCRSYGSHWRERGLNFAVSLGVLFFRPVAATGHTLGNSHILLFAGLLAGSQHESERSFDRASRHRFSWFSSVLK